MSVSEPGRVHTGGTQRGNRHRHVAGTWGELNKHSWGLGDELLWEDVQMVGARTPWSSVVLGARREGPSGILVCPLLLFNVGRSQQ